MKKQEMGTALAAAATTVMALIMTWINLRHPGNHGGPKLLLMMFLLVLWCGAWLHQRFPQTIRFFRHAVAQSLGVAMGFWIFAAGELFHRLRYAGGSTGDWIVFGIFSVIFLWIMLTGGEITAQEEP